MPTVSPSEIARKTLETLAKHKLSPTPENYQRIYAEISGEDVARFESQHNLLRHLSNYVATHPRFLQNGQALEKAIKTLDWESFFIALKNSAATTAKPEVESKLVSSADTENNKLLNRIVELFGETLINTLGQQSELKSEIQDLVSHIRSAKTQEQAEQLNQLLQPFCNKARLHHDNKDKIHDGLVRLLRLFVQNIGSMVEDEDWLHGQIAILQSIIANPMDRAAISDAERNLRNAIINQNMLKTSVADTKNQLKGLMTSFIDRLGDITTSTGDYQQKISGYTERLGSADQINELGSLLNEIMADTQGMQSRVSRSHQELIHTQQKTEEADAKIRALEQQLAEVSELVHQDQLTGALNRRGLDAVFDREFSRAERQQHPLSLALLDIDNFKQLNDSMGHQAGDHALVHLCNVIRECIRPTDAVARFGGEEFIIIMPECPLQAAADMVGRLQRDLTKKFFMENNNRVLLTFSAGVAEWVQQESQDDLIARADHAMYRAKKTGKNRVEIAQ